MRTRSGIVIAVLTALSLAVSPSAWAATEIGSNCSATGGAGKYTLIQLDKSAGNPLSLSAPSAGVITQWKVNVGVPALPTLGQRLEVFRATGNPNEFQAVAVSDVGTVVTGQNVFPTRIPVQAGDRIGGTAQGEVQAVFFCKGDSAAKMGAHPGEVPVGSTQTFEIVPEHLELALAAVIEPDADNDGFGDETQDKCPQSAALQTECPVIVLDSFALAKKSSILVLVAASETGKVSVSGTAKLPKSSKASSSAKAKLKKVTKKVTAGKITSFTLKFPGNLKSALRSLPRGKSLTVKLEATAKNVAGQVSKDKSKLKLKG
jgi:hypothetical protein